MTAIGSQGPDGVLRSTIGVASCGTWSKTTPTSGSTTSSLASTRRLTRCSTGSRLAFLEARSSPMFRSLPGCLGVAFLRDGYEVTVVSIWNDAAAIESLETNALYNETVQELGRRDILEPIGPVTVQGCDGLIARS
jgi:heme-degrading monooxygenase HmoA